MLVLVRSYVFHFLVIIVVQLVIRRLFLAQIDVEILSNVILLNAFLHFVHLEHLRFRLGEVEVGLRS